MLDDREMIKGAGLRLKLEDLGTFVVTCWALWFVAEAIVND